jgi:hypothetical protein
MKRIFSLLFAAMLVVQAWAEDNYDFSAVCSSGQTLYYKITSNTEPYTVAVTYPKEVNYYYYVGYTEPAGNIVIPSEVENNGIKYNVTCIGESAFDKCETIKSVIIPNTVTSIEYSAFAFCSIESVTIGNSVTEIGNQAFRNSDLKSITIPNSVTSIEGGAFFECYYLKSITIPSTVTNIGDGVCASCLDLTEINVESENTEYTSDNGILFNKNKTTIMCYPAGKTESSYTIPNGVTNIANDAFNDCFRLTSITIPNSVTSIGRYAFFDCENIKSVSIPNSVTSIGESAFMHCSNLSLVTIPNSVTTVGFWAFYGCTNSTIICEAETKPKGWDGSWNRDCRKVAWNVQVCENNDFEFKYDSSQDYKVATLVKYKGSADTVSVPSAVFVDGEIYTVNQIGDEAFSGCASLKSVKLPSDIKGYGKMAFKNCTALEFIFVPQLVTSIGEDAFYGCTTATIACEADSKPKGWNSNWNNNGGRVVWNAQLSENNDFEFEYDSTLDGNYIARLVKYKGYSESVSVPTVIITDSAEYTVIYVNKKAFSENRRIKTVKLPNTLRGFGERAFENCTSLESIVIPDSVDRISESMFSGCSSLKSVEFSPSIEYIMNGAFEKSGLEFVALPKTVTSIYDFAFAECENLKLVYIPETVVKNEYYAFVDCTNATIYCAAAKQPETWKELWNEDGGKVVWGHSVPADSTLELKFATKSDGTAAVTECLSESSSVEVPMMVMVDSSAYFVTSITGQPFFNCRNLNSINVDSENKIFASVDGVLYNKEKTKLIVCPPKKTGTVTIPNTVTSIETMAFTGCEDLQSVEIPNSVTEIGGWAFSGCAGLESIPIPNSVTSIGDAAFRRCLGLTEITIPKSVVNMGSEVFAERETPITVYCEVSRKPEGWNDNWDSVYGTTPCNVVWADNTPVAETAANAVNIYAHGNTIVVENATDEISVYDAMGRLVGRDAIHRVSAKIHVNGTGLYIVKVGNVAKRVMVNE